MTIHKIDGCVVIFQLTYLLQLRLRAQRKITHFLHRNSICFKNRGNEASFFPNWKSRLQGNTSSWAKCFLNDTTQNRKHFFFVIVVVVVVVHFECDWFVALYARVLPYFFSYQHHSTAAAAVWHFQCEQQKKTVTIQMTETYRYIDWVFTKKKKGRWWWRQQYSTLCLCE